MTTKITYKGYINYKAKGQVSFYTHNFSGITEQEYEKLKARFSDPEKYIFIGGVKTRDKIELGE